MSTPSLYFDEDSSEKEVTDALKEVGLDVRSAVEVGNTAIEDEEQLEYAVSEERVLFSFNKEDFARIHKEWANRGKKHWGILLGQQQCNTTKKLIRSLRKFCQRNDKSSLKNAIRFL